MLVLSWVKCTFTVLVDFEYKCHIFSVMVIFRQLLLQFFGHDCMLPMKAQFIVSTSVFSLMSFRGLKSAGSYAVNFGQSILLKCI